MANEFQQMFGVFQGAQQNLQNQVLSRQSLAIRQEELGLNRERLQAQREANTLDAMKVQETQVSNRIGMLTSLGEFLSVEDQKHFAESISEDLIKMGRLSPEKAVSYANLEDYRLGVHASLIEGDYEKAQGLFLDFSQHSHPKERAMGLDVLRQEQAVIEARGPFRRAIEDRKAGRIIDQTTADKLRAEDAVGLQQRLDSGDIQSIVSNETMQAIRAKELEADGLRLLDPKMVSDALTIQQMADRGLVVPDEKVQQAVALQQYVDLNKTYANLLANGIEPADSFLSMYHAAAVKAGIQEKVKAPPGAKELEEIEASRVRRRTAKFQQNLLAQKAILFENESLKIQQDIAKGEAMIPQIDAITELTRAKTGSEQAKTSLLNAQYTNLQKSMQAILPEYQQELQELSTDRQEIVQQLSLLATNAEANPNQLELLQDQLKQNEDRAQYVQSLVAFGQAVGPDRALKYAQFDEQRQQAEARLKRNSATMEELRRKTADLRVAQTDSKELDTRLKRKQDEKNDALVLVANEATRRGIGRDAKAVTGLIDEMGFGKVLTAGDVGKALKEGESTENSDPFAVTRAVSTAIGIAAKNSNVAVINPVTGQVDAIALYDKNPKETVEYIKLLQTQADSNPALKQGLQPIIDQLKDTQRRIEIQKKRYQSVEQKLPHNLKAQVHPDGRTMEDIIEQIDDGATTQAQFKSDGVIFTVQRGASGKTEISAKLDGEELTFALEGTGDKRKWIFLDKR